MFEKIKKHLTCITIAPLVILGYGQLASLVYFIDWVEFAQDIITEENVEAFSQVLAKIQYLMEEIEKLKDFHRD